MLIYLANLTHTQHGLTNELTPYALGCLKGYLLTRMDAEVCLFTDPVELDHALHERTPDIVGLSYYMWNATLTDRVAERIRRHYPGVLLVQGGPNLPLEREAQKQWLEERPWVDVYLLGEAEATFTQLCQAYRDRDQIRHADINGLLALVDGRLRAAVAQRSDGTDDYPRMRELGAVPSPYLLGYLDPWLADPRYVPALACTRGCPFTCAYCVSGLSCYSTVCRYPMERVLAEARYIAERYRGQTLYMTDDNFGMFAEDVAFAEGLAQIQQETGWPKWIVVSAGKNHKERLIQTAQLLDGAFRVGASVQSTDPDVLRAIRRDNLSPKGMVETALALKDATLGPYSEVIMGLPEDTREKHLTSILSLVEWGFEQIRMHQLTLFDGMVLSTQAKRDQYHLRTRWRVLQRSYGAYVFVGEPLYAAETEEVVVASDTFTLEDYRYGRRFALTVALLHNDGAFRELRHLIESEGLRWADFLRYAHDRVETLPEDHEVRQHYSTFAQETEDELHETREEIDAQVSREDGALLRGTTIGQNRLYNTVGHLWYHHGPSVVAAVFGWARTFLEDVPEPWFAELLRYCFLTRGHLSDLDAVDDASLLYDFTHASPKGLRRSTRFRFAFAPWQKDLFRNQLALYGTTDAGLGKIIARSPMRHTYREATPC